MKSLQSVSLIASTAILLVGFNSLSANWFPATATPPNGNVPAPINVGTSTQQKDGVLGVDGLGVFGSAYIQGASTTDTYNNAVTLEVEGKIGADLYCDERGENCVTTLGQAGTSTNLVGGMPELSDSLVVGWPDILLCNTYNNMYAGLGNNPPRAGAPYQVASDVVFHRNGRRTADGLIFYEGFGGMTGAGTLAFNIDGSHAWTTGLNQPGECAGKSMAQLSAEGRTFAYGVSQYSFVTNVRYIAGGHALTKTLQDAGVPGIQNWNISSIAARNTEMAWICNYFHPGSVPVDVRIGAYRSPSDNGIHLLDANGQWQWYGARAYNQRIDGLYCRLP